MNLNYFLEFSNFKKIIFWCGQPKKIKLKKKAKSTPHKRIWWVGWGRGYFGKKLQGCKSNRKFYKDENQKWHILQRWKTILTLLFFFQCIIQMILSHQFVVGTDFHVQVSFSTCNG